MRAVGRAKVSKSLYYTCHFSHQSHFSHNSHHSQLKGCLRWLRWLWWLKWLADTAILDRKVYIPLVFSYKILLSEIENIVFVTVKSKSWVPFLRFSYYPTKVIPGICIIWIENFLFNFYISKSQKRDLKKKNRKYTICSRLLRLYSDGKSLKRQVFHLNGTAATLF